MTDSEAAAVADGRDDLPFMVHSELDDLDLDPFEFRAYSHMVRRAGKQGDKGEHWESVEASAKHCRMDPKTYRRALQGLVERRLVTREDRPGQTSVYRLTPPKLWRPLPETTGVQPPTPTKYGRATTSGRGTGSGRGTPTKYGRTPLPETVDKGSPTKGIPLKEEQPTREKTKPKKPKKELKHEFNPAEVSQDLPDNFDRELFQDFCARRLEVDAPMTLLALKQFITKHKRHPPEILDEMFRSAIVAGWKDLYPPRGTPQHEQPNDPTFAQYTERGL